jgi:hypothetical protein
VPGDGNGHVVPWSRSGAYIGLGLGQGFFPNNCPVVLSVCVMPKSLPLWIVLGEIACLTWNNLHASLPVVGA